MKLKTILYVDDEEDLRDLVKLLLQADGYRVRTAANVTEALKIAFGEFPDLVITDVIMPNESGYSLCSKLRADPSTSDLPIVVLTVLEDEQRALDVGATAFLSKPIEAERLRQVVADVLKPTDSRTLLNEALAAVRAGDRHEAKEKLIELLTQDPTSPMAKWARYYVAQIEQIHGNVRGAIQQFSALLDEDPSFWRAHNRLGQIHEEGGDWNQARRHYERSLALNANQRELRSRIEILRS